MLVYILFVNISLDDAAPVIQRAYVQNNLLFVQTDENAICKYADNSSTGCSFNFDDSNISTMSGEGLAHTASYVINKDYYIRCSDIYNNTQMGCGIIIKAY